MHVLQDTCVQSGYATILLADTKIELYSTDIPPKAGHNGRG